MMSDPLIDVFFFFFKQKTAYEIYQCDWSSDVCSSDLGGNLALYYRTTAGARSGYYSVWPLHGRGDRGLSCKPVHTKRTHRRVCVHVGTGYGGKPVSIHAGEMVESHQIQHQGLYSVRHLSGIDADAHEQFMPALLFPDFP